MNTAEQVEQTSYEECSLVIVEKAPRTLFDAVRSGTLTQDQFETLMASASLRGAWSTPR